MELKESLKGDILRVDGELEIIEDEKETLSTTQVIDKLRKKYLILDIIKPNVLSNTLEKTRKGYWLFKIQVDKRIKPKVRAVKVKTSKE